MKFGEMFKVAVRSRGFWVFAVVGLAEVIAVVLITAFSLREAAVNVPVHYTPFAVENFLYDKWYYAVAFPVFAVVIYAVHIFSQVKLLAIGKRGLMVVAQVTGILVLLFTIIVTLSIFGVIRLRLQV